ncbi:RNA polymerase sigma factor [Saccharopolyspora taberi]|uniref:RNA polymerase sigma factor n=1 Tax=Saccharopolyspora taberi TaxID=60895 RepID=A0ABN3VQC1_9PSEU
MEPTDAVLGARVAAGDEVAFTELVRRHSDPVFGLALRMLNDRAEAEDVVQDVFATAWREMAGVTDFGATRAWLFQIARRRCLIVLRRRRTRRTYPVAVVPELAGSAGDPQRLAEVGQGVRALGLALAGLPAGQRDVWLLAEIHGLSSLEIGRRVGAGEQAVRGRLSRARATLADAMRAWR